MAITKVVGVWPLPDGVTLEEVNGILRIKDGGVTESKIADAAVSNAKLQNASITINAGTGMTGGGTVSLGGSTTLGIADGGIGTSQLADSAVTAVKIADGAVTNDKLAGKYVEFVDIKNVENVSSVTFSGLSLKYNIFYMLYVRILNNSGSTMGLKVYRGDDTTQTNYWSRRLIYNQSGVSCSGGNDTIIAETPSYTHLNAIIWLTVDKGNDLRAFLNGVRDDPDYSDGIIGTVSGITSGAPISSIIVESTVANAIKGTFMLFKLRGE